MLTPCMITTRSLSSVIHRPAWVSAPEEPTIAESDEEEADEAGDGVMAARAAMAADEQPTTSTATARPTSTGREVRIEITRLVLEIGSAPARPPQVSWALSFDGFDEMTCASGAIAT